HGMRGLVRAVLFSFSGFVVAFGVPRVPYCDARTLAVVPRVSLRVRPPPRLAPGSPGTLVHAIAAQDKRRRYKRPQSEGNVPERDPDGVCPTGMSNVDARFCVDRWEGALVEVADDGTERSWPPTHALNPDKHYRATSAPGVVPQGYVSGEEAQTACHAS